MEGGNSVRIAMEDYMETRVREGEQQGSQEGYGEDQNREAGSPSAEAIGR